MFESIFGAISSAISSIKNWVEQRINEVKNLINSSISSLKSWVDSSLQSLKNYLVELINSVRKSLESSISSLSSSFSSQISSLKSSFDSSISSIKNYFQNLISNVSNTLQNAIDGLRNSFAQFSKSITEKVDGILNFLKELPGKVWDWIIDKLANFLQQVFAYIQKRSIEGYAYMLDYVVSNLPDYIKTTYVANVNIILTQFNLPIVKWEEIEEDTKRVVERIRSEYGIERNIPKVIAI